MRFEFVTYLIAFFPVFLLPVGTGEVQWAEGSRSRPVLQGIITNGDYAAEELVRDIFADGACESISNIQSIGNTNGIGYFENGGNIIGLENGIILATGEISNAAGPNDDSDISGDFSDNSGDQDLDSIAVEKVFDAVGIEFDFEPLDSFVTFRYVFASEEYCEFVGSDYNDVFGFFVSGPGISGGFTGNAENVALIPGTDNFVTINSVNRNTNSSFYIGNERPENADECNVPFVLSQQDNLEYDGFTVELTALLKVIPCERYHIRMVIGDVKDSVYDSAVFLEAKSFNLGARVEVSSISMENDGIPTVTEGCNDAWFLFEREEDAPNNFPLTVNYYLSGESTATEGIDFESITQSVVIPAGLNAVVVPVVTLNDDLTESPESIVLVLDIACACYADSANIVIVDPDTLEVLLSDIYICENESFLQSPIVQGGNPPYTYLWSNGEVTHEIVIPAGGADQYSVTVFDACGHIGTDTSQIYTTQAPIANLSGINQICEGDTTWFSVLLKGISPYSLVYAIDGVLQEPIYDITENSFALPASSEGIYELIQINDQACGGTVTGTAYLDIMEIDAEIFSSDVSCNGFSDGIIDVVLTGDNPPYVLNWSNNPGGDTLIENLFPGNYYLSVEDTMGCVKDFEITVGEPTALEPIRIDCESLTGDEVIINTTGGTAPYLYAVDGGAFKEESLFEELIIGNLYELIVQDANGCLLEQDFIMPAVYERMFDLPARVKVLPGEQYQITLQLNFPESLLASVIWAPATNLSCTDCLNPVFSAVQEGTYVVQIRDVFGCRSFAAIDIIIDPEIDYFVPTIFSPNGDQINDNFLPFFNEKDVSRILLFQVFNRWGGMMFESKNFLPNTVRKGWDGTLGGKELNSGVYVFLIKVQLTDGAEKVITGDVVLMK